MSAPNTPAAGRIARPRPWAVRRFLRRHLTYEWFRVFACRTPVHRMVFSASTVVLGVAAIAPAGAIYRRVDHDLVVIGILWGLATLVIAAYTGLVREPT